jgi:tetratricopeptide (TPR) repeat protein
MADSPRIEELRRRVLVDPASIAFAALAEEYRRAGRYVEAVATCQAGLQRHPAYLSARVTLGRALLEMGQYDEARDQLEQVLRVAPENLAAMRGIADIHHRRGELPEALAQYKSALSVSQHDPELQRTVETIARQVAPAEAGAPGDPAAGPEAPPAPPPGVPLPVSVQAVMPVDAPAPPAPFDIQAIFDEASPPAPAPGPPASSAASTLEALEQFLGAIRRARQHDPAAHGSGSR